MSSKEEALFTQERVLSISGDTGRCIKCSHLVLAKLSEQDEIIPYASRGDMMMMMMMMPMDDDGDCNGDDGW